ncbi:DUF1501 domain-containing protein [Emticicia sp. CRIBPO]|uniref:DUF1501 domain-containing protein n=1 Tax=Emticicia sp. CRIBPO TaxID=2683258 RepID=UPI001412C361|nr:DUF1501 domain-containing protein [Emticicia sp. CRIBPO]NBA86746.1 DUF1501 domain-containing protein [Emticicia sp. CRIBPO]
MSIIKEALEKDLHMLRRRHFLKQCASGMGAMALGSMMGGCNTPSSGNDIASQIMEKLPHFAPKAKRVIYLHMAGSPSQLELFDYKPELEKWHGKDCPEEFLKGKTFAFIRGTPKMLGPQGKFAQHGQSGAWVSDYLPHFQHVVDEVCFMKAMHTDQFNHAPAQLFMQTGSARLGRPGMGSWAVYGLGSENENLPGFIVLTSSGRYPEAGKSIWGSGFLPSIYQGVHCRSDGEPVLYVKNPDGIDRDLRKEAINTINEINHRNYEEFQDPETLARIAQYELAFKMQTEIPNTMDISKEPDYIHNMYGTTIGQSSFANNCLLARKLVESGVRFVQLYDWGWDTHGSSASEALEIGLWKKCQETDQAMSALLLDLKQRGLLDETLVVWSGEFGRTPMQENRDNKPAPFMGRDHHVEAYTIWMAGAGVKKGFTYGETDDIGYFGVKGKTHVHDLQATILHLMGLDHEKLTYDFQGRPFRLTDVAGKVVTDILA